MTMHTLVTGGAGFIGSTLVDSLLGKGHSVDVVDDLSSGSLSNLSQACERGASFLFEQMDVRDESLAEFVCSRAPEVVFHLAAQPSVAVSLEDPHSDAAVNILGSLRVLDAAAAAGARKVVFAASGGTLYGDAPRSALPLKEDRPRLPASPYGISKMVVLNYLGAYKTLRDLDYTALALANVYGPRQDAHGEAGVVAIFAGNLAASRHSTIFGDGDQTRDFVYVDDVVDAFVRAADAGEGRVFNIGTGAQTSVNDLYGLLAAAAGKLEPPNYAPARTGEVLASALDPSEARALLGWEPRMALRDGLARVLQSQPGFRTLR